MKQDLSERSNRQAQPYIDPNNTSDVLFLRQQLDNKKREMDGFKDNIRQLKQNLKEAETDTGRERQEVSDRAAFYESESKKYRGICVIR